MGLSYHLTCLSFEVNEFHKPGNCLSLLDFFLYAPLRDTARCTIKDFPKVKVVAKFKKIHRREKLLNCKTKTAVGKLHQITITKAMKIFP